MLTVTDSGASTNVVPEIAGSDTVEQIAVPPVIDTLRALEYTSLLAIAIAPVLVSK